MESPRVHFVRFAGEIRGPLAVEHLRDLGEVGVITPQTEVAPSANGPWVALETLALAAEVFPARRAMEFRAKEFEPLNRDSTPAIGVDEIKHAAMRIPAAFRGREVIVTPLTPRAVRPDAPNDVQEMVLEVGRKIAANAPPEILPPPPPRFPQWRWYAAGAVLGTGFLLCIPLFYRDRESDVFTFSILGGWIVLYNGFLAMAASMDWGLRQLISRRKMVLDVRRDG